MKEDKKKKTVTKKKETVKKTTKKSVAEPKKEKLTNVVSKKETVLLDDKSQKNLKVLSKVLYILAKIGRIFLMICVPFIFLAMVAIPFLMKHLEINGNIIKFYDATVIVNEDSVTFKLGNSDYVSNEDYKDLKPIANFISNNTKGDILVVSEVSLFFIAIILVVTIYLLMYIERLFKNIHEKNTPFNDENTDYIRRIGFVMCISLVVRFVFELMMSIFFPDFVSESYSSFGLFEILIVFALYYIFRYATKMQKETNYKIYK